MTSLNSDFFVGSGASFDSDLKGELGSGHELSLELVNGSSFSYRSKSYDQVGDSDIIHEVFNEDEYGLEKTVLTEDDVVIDIGSHIGSFAVRSGFSGARIYCFEPHPGNFELLSKNVASLVNVSVYNAGVTAEGQSARLILSQSNTGAHSIFGSGEGTPISGVNLNDFVKKQQINRVRLLKLDCEGAEYPILLGMNKQDLSVVSEIVFEQHNTSETLKFFKPESLTSHLERCGFDVTVEKEVTYSGEGTFWLVRATRSV